MICFDFDCMPMFIAVYISSKFHDAYYGLDIYVFKMHKHKRIHVMSEMIMMSINVGPFSTETHFSLQSTQSFFAVSFSFRI